MLLIIILKSTANTHPHVFVICCSGGASPKFVVTLDAVTDMSKLLPHTANIDIDDIDLLDNSNMDASESSKNEVSNHQCTSMRKR